MGKRVGKVKFFILKEFEPPIGVLVGMKIVNGESVWQKRITHPTPIVLELYESLRQSLTMYYPIFLRVELLWVSIRRKNYKTYYYYYDGGNEKYGVVLGHRYTKLPEYVKKLIKEVEDIILLEGKNGSTTN